MSWRENACGLWDRVPRILDPGANEARISDYPFIIPPQFSHYPVTIWRRRSESHCVTDSFQTSQPPCKSINYARSPVKSGFQRSSRNASTIVSKSIHHLSTILPVSFYWNFYWRSLVLPSSLLPQPNALSRRENTRADRRNLSPHFLPRRHIGGRKMPFAKLELF